MTAGHGPLIGVLCGMAAEARALGPLAADARILIANSGARPDRAEAEARRLAAAGVRALLSWGVAGGLDPALRPGDLVIPAAVVAEAGGDGARWACAPLPDVPAASDAPILGVERMIASVAEKRALRAATGAAALDMESLRVARVAAARGLPLLVIRAVGDPAGRALPKSALRGLRPDGRPRLAPVLAGLLRRPGELPALMALKRDTDAALATLSAAAEALPALFPAFGAAGET